jgi:hypothetical protein
LPVAVVVSPMAVGHDQERERERSRGRKAYGVVGRPGSVIGTDRPCCPTRGRGTCLGRPDRRVSKTVSHRHHHHHHHEEHDPAR